MLAASPAILRHQVDEWLRWLADANPATNAVLPEVEDLAISAFRCLRHWLDVRALDARLLAWSTVDLDDVATVLELLQDAPTDSANNSEMRNHLSVVGNGISKLRTPGAAIDANEMLGAFQTLDHHLEQALLCVVDQWRASRQLIALVRKRLESLTTSALQKIWSSILQECDLGLRSEGDYKELATANESTEVRFLVGRSRSVSCNFFAVTSIESEMKDRIAKYTAWLRSRLYREALKRGRQYFPADRPLGLVRALSLRSFSEQVAPSEAECVVARCVGTLCGLTADSMQLYRSAEDLLSLEQRGLILGVYATPRPSAGVARERALLFVLRRLLTACEDMLTASEMPKIHIVERAFLHLQRLIVADADVRRKWQSAFNSRNGEIACERLGGAHLLHHGIYAIKSNASGERTDLVLGTRLAITSKIQRSSDAMALTEWKRIRDRVTPDKAVRAARKQALRYAGGSLAGFEIATVRFLVTVSKDVLDEMADELRGGVMYRHVNIAVAPSTPSVRNR